MIMFIKSITVMNSKKKEVTKTGEYGCTLFIDTLEDHPQLIADQLGLKAAELIIKGSNWLSPVTKRIINGKFNEHNLLMYSVEKECWRL
jgi:hypothetical protein